MRAPHVSFFFVVVAVNALAFSQRTPVTAVGHEWLTVRAAADAAKEADASRLSGKGDWSGSGCEKGCPGHEYGATNYLVWSTALGQRWVDLGGFSMSTAGHRSCWDALTQSPDDLQYDHFLRARDDAGPTGGLKAMNESVKRFRKYFLAAVAEKDGVKLRFMDGGAASGVLAGEFNADRAYFLFGRAAHLFQDSFSLEHAVRKSGDGFKTLQGIKSYVCSDGSPQHGHSAPGAASNLLAVDPSKPSRSLAQLTGWGSEPSEYEKNGDVVWKSPTGGEGDDNVKPHAKAAQAAMRDLWLAFERARAKKVSPEAAVDELIARWMTISGNGGDSVSFDAKKCAADASLQSNKTVEALRQKCLDLTGRNGDDASKPPYSWAAPGAAWPDGDLLDQAGAAVGDAAEAVGDAADDVGDVAEDAADDVKKAGKKAKKKTKKKAKDTKDALEKLKDKVDDVF